jgi:hypothetical protein
MIDSGAGNATRGDSSASPPQSEEAKGANGTAALPAHMQILDELEGKARRCCVGGTDVEEWTLADDARLASFVQEFTTHIQRRAESIADAVVGLENKKDRAATKVELAKSAFVALPDQRFVQQVVLDGTGAGDSTEEEAQQEGADGGHENDTNAADEEQDATKQQQDLEDQAIKDGMKALQLFYDPAQATGAEDHYFGLDQGDDSACYYEFAMADAFNQRPLPFVVGSKEFMESKDAGLGDDGGAFDDEADREDGDGATTDAIGDASSFLLGKGLE